MTIGLDAVLGYKAGGYGEAGDFLELANARDVTFDVSHSEADLTSRANNGWRATEPVLKEGELSFQMIWDPADAGFTAIRTAWEGRSIIGMAVLDGPLDSGKGWKFNGKVIGFTVNQPLEEGIVVDVTIKPTYSTDVPTYVTSGVNEGA